MASSTVSGWMSSLLFFLGWRRNKFFATFLICFFFATYAFVRQLNANEIQARIGNPIIQKQEDEIAMPVLKTILYWNSFFGIRDFTFGFGQQPFIDAQCPTPTCYVTDNRTLFNESDVVIFSIQNLNLLDLPTHRFAHQRFVFYEMESPANTDSKPLLFERTRFGFFNWTMTYRLDSDVVHRDSYGVTIPRRRKLPSMYPNPRRGYPSIGRKDVSPYISGKKKLAAWFVSNCVTSSHREDYVKELSRYVPVDIYGKCGNLSCLSNDTRRCREMVRSDYKFYVAFENSLCPDYVTEKLTAGLLYDAVPVVMGGVDYTAFAPPHSFIDVNDFASPKQLANYLLLLDATDALYARYFDWKRDFTVHLNPKQGWCHLCELAHNDQLPSFKIYDDILQWWINDPDHCNLPTVP